MPAAWLGSLALLSGHWVTNLARVGGALAVTGLSILVPALGTWTAAGWLMSGAVGGATIGLGLLAMGDPGTTPTAT